MASVVPLKSRKIALTDVKEIAILKWNDVRKVRNKLVVRMVNGFFSYFIVLAVFVLVIAAAIALGIFLRIRKNNTNNEQAFVPNETGNEDDVSNEPGETDEE